MNIKKEKISTSVAITGSLASGKTFVLNYLKSINYPVFSCDDFVRKLYEDINIQNQILLIIDELTSFNKKELVHIIYNKPQYRKKLEEYIHPLVRKAIEDFKQQFNKNTILFFEVPLLFETGFDKHFDYSICVFCSESVRLKRAQIRNNFDLAIYNKIKQVQLLAEEKIKKADFVINTEMESLEIYKLINSFLDKIK
jgi:dephospho-CoA kinase